MNIITRKIKNRVPRYFIDLFKRSKYKVYLKKMNKKYSSIKKFDANVYQCGINLIGDITAETGLGQSMRILAGMIRKCNISLDIFQVEQYESLVHNDQTWKKEITNEVKYGINVIHINPVEWAESYVKLESRILDGRYNIAFWLWELEEFPDEWIPLINSIDEIWTPSEFIARGIRTKTKKKVVTVPYTINYLSNPIYDRAYFHLPKEQFLFLMMYDSISICERKNPFAVINSFKKAFSAENKEVGLIIKINHLQSDTELLTLKMLMKDYKYVYYLTENMERKEIESLLAVSNVYVSLHRAEGYGLVLAEAMYYGTPVIATGWSANTEFMDEESAFLVDYQIVTLEKKVGPYNKGMRWADGDTNQAAEFMKTLYKQNDIYQKYCIASKKKSIAMQGIGECIIKERVKAIYEENSICQSKIW